MQFRLQLHLHAKSDLCSTQLFGAKKQVTLINLCKKPHNKFPFSIFQLAVGAVLGGAIYVLKESKSVLGFTIEPSLSEDNEKNAILFSLFLIVIVVFAFLTIFTFLGCCGSAWESSCMIGSFVIILFIFLGANVGGIVFMYFHYHDEVDLASDELGKWIGKYLENYIEAKSNFLFSQTFFFCLECDV